MKQIAAANKGQITAAMFIGRRLNRKIEIIKYNFLSKLNDPVEIATGDSTDNCWPCGQLHRGKICAAGVHLDVVANSCSTGEHGDRIGVRTRLQEASESTRLVKIFEMTIDAYGKTYGDVGGDVDAATITKNGSITWNSNKDNCPENE